MTRSFHGQASSRSAVIERVRAHMEHGTIGRDVDLDENDGTVSLVGCLGWDHGTGPVNHSAYYDVAKQIGLPSWLLLLADLIHNELPEDQQRTWPLRLIEAIAVDVHLDPVSMRVGSWIFNDPTNGLAVNEDERTVRGKVAAMYRNWASVPLKEWMTIRDDMTINDPLVFAGVSAAMNHGQLVELAGIGARLTDQPCSQWISALADYLLDRLRNA